jgi:aromatic ring hydroxylase
MKAISEYTSISELRQIMQNAKRAKRDDVYWEAFKRACELEGAVYDDQLHRDFYSTLAAYEELLTEKNGRTTKANRTRQKLDRKGVVQCLEDWANKATETQGFTLLVANNLVHLTGEFLVLKYRDHFTEKAVKNAGRRLQNVELKADLAEALGDFRFG